jgi:hypothetical protein
MSSEKRLVLATETAVESYVLAAPLTGYKAVTNTYDPALMQSSEVYAVGSRHTLKGTAVPHVERLGFHFATHPLVVLAYVAWKPTHRLVRIEVPRGATVSTNGINYAASAMTVVSDETASIATLLTGVLVQRMSYRTAYTNFVGGISVSDGDTPAILETWGPSKYRRKTWYADVDDRSSVSVTRSPTTTAVWQQGEYVDATPEWEARVAKQEWYELVGV